MTYIEEVKQKIEESKNPMTVVDIIRIMGFSDAKVYRLIKSGELEAMNIGSGSKRSLWIIEKQALLDFINRRQNGTRK